MGKFECKKCGKSFSDKSGLSRHTKSIHEGKRYNCERCDKTFSGKSSLSEHVKSIHESKKYECYKCEKYFANHSGLLRHTKSIHEGIRYNCERCDKTFAGKSALTSHIKSIHENEKYECDKCEKSYTDKETLKIHQEWHKMKEEGLIFQCRDCNVTFTTKPSFYRHVRNFHASKQFEPLIVLDKTEPLANPQKNTNIEPKEIDENLKSARKVNVLPKPKKGKWIVKLERLNISDLH